MSNHINPKDRRKMTIGEKQLKVQEEKQKPTQVKLFAGRYQILDNIGKGVSSYVMSAIDMKTGEKVAIKKIKNFLENKHQSLRVLREILLLRKLKHPNVIDLKEIILEDGDVKELSLVLEFLPTDIKKIFKSNRMLSITNIKTIVFGILIALNYCQQSQVLHRDLKPENILIDENLSKVTLCDFGLARAVVLEEEDFKKHEQSEMKAEEEEQRKRQVIQANKSNLTAHVSTRWYRAPQLILLERKYNSAIDIWSVGCILGELMTMLDTSFADRKPLFPGKACYPLSPPKSPDMNYKKVNDFPHSVYDQLSVIFSIIGTPTDIEFITDERARNYIKSFDKIQKRPFKEIFKLVNPLVEDFLQKSLEFNPNKRMTIQQALNHKFFDDIRQKYEYNLSIKGEPIVMDLEGIQIEKIRELVLEEYNYFQNLNKQL